MIATLLLWLKSRVVQIGLAIAAALAALAALRADAYRDGKRAADTDAKEKDRDRAEEIRRRGDAARAPRGLRHDDDRGYRD